MSLPHDGEKKFKSKVGTGSSKRIETGRCTSEGGWGRSLVGRRGLTKCESKSMFPKIDYLIGSIYKFGMIDAG